MPIHRKPEFPKDRRGAHLSPREEPEVDAVAPAPAAPLADAVTLAAFEAWWLAGPVSAGDLDDVGVENVAYAAFKAGWIAVRAEPPREEGGAAGEALSAARRAAIDEHDASDIPAHLMGASTRAVSFAAGWDTYHSTQTTPAAARAPGPVDGEALRELLDALDESHGGTFDPYPGRLLTAYAAARELVAEPAP